MYLLAPGFFHQRVLAAGADVVSPPIGVHDALARLILRRYDEAAASYGPACPQAAVANLPQNATPSA